MLVPCGYKLGAYTVGMKLFQLFSASHLELHAFLTY